MPSNDLTFGETIRQARESRGLTLRKFAQMLDLSATFVSRMERDELAVPSEDNIRLIAEILDLNADALLGKVGRVPSDVKEIYLQKPEVMATFLRTVGNKSPEEIKALTEKLKTQEDPKG